MPSSKYFGTCSLNLAAFIILTVALAPAGAQSAAPFAAFSGAWSGGGSVSMADGSRAKIRCRANYATQDAGASMQIRIDCASDSYKIQIVSGIAAGAGGRISGTWQELSRQVSGGVSGRLSAPGEVEADLGGTPYDIRITLTTRGKQQNVSMRLENSDVQSVNIGLHRN